MKNNKPNILNQRLETNTEYFCFLKLVDSNSDPPNLFGLEKDGKGVYNLTEASWFQ